MFYVSDNLKTLGEALPFSGSILESVLGYVRMFPGVESVTVYRDCGRRGNRSDFQFISTINRKSIDKIILNIKDKSRL